MGTWDQGLLNVVAAFEWTIVSVLFFPRIEKFILIWKRFSAHWPHLPWDPTRGSTTVQIKDIAELPWTCEHYTQAPDKMSTTPTEDIHLYSVGPNPTGPAGWSWRSHLKLCCSTPDTIWNPRSSTLSVTMYYKYVGTHSNPRVGKLKIYNFSCKVLFTTYKTPSRGKRNEWYKENKAA